MPPAEVTRKKPPLLARRCLASPRSDLRRVLTWTVNRVTPADLTLVHSFRSVRWSMVDRLVDQRFWC